MPSLPVAPPYRAICSLCIQRSTSTAALPAKTIRGRGRGRRQRQAPCFWRAENANCLLHTASLPPTSRIAHLCRMRQTACAALWLQEAGTALHQKSCHLSGIDYVVCEQDVTDAFATSKEKFAFLRINVRIHVTKQIIVSKTCASNIIHLYDFPI